MEPATVRIRSAHRKLGLLAVLAAMLTAAVGCTKSDDPQFYIARLGSGNAETQRRAVEDLLLINKQAMPFIKDAVKDSNANLRIGCAEFLSRVRRMESLTILGELIDDPDPAVRLKAIESVAKLSQVWKTEAVKLLSRGFEGSDPACVKAAGEGLRDMEFTEATDYLQAQFDAQKGIQTVYAAKLLYETEGKEAFTQPILQGLISTDPDTRKAAEANAMALTDKIVVPLVKFVRGEQKTMLAKITLDKIRDALRDELDVILDSARAEKVLMALGAIGDQDSVDRLKADLHDSKLESTWRVAAARALAGAAQAGTGLSAQITGDLGQILKDEKEDQRIQIGAAIALCELKQPSGVEFLLNTLDKFEDAIGQENISEERVHDLTALRIGAQEALAQSGEFVVPFLMKRLQGKPSPTIMWAAAKTLGEMGQKDAVSDLGRYLISKKKPEITIDDEGRLSGQIKDADGKPTGDVADADWSKATDAEKSTLCEQLEVFEYPDYVRWTAALALGRIGGTEAEASLHAGEQAESALLDRLAKCKERPGYFKRAPVLDQFAGTHEDVLFYIRRALEDV